MPLQHLSRWGERKGSGAQAAWCARGPGSGHRTGGYRGWAGGARGLWLLKAAQQKGEEDRRTD